ncbi:hypothetical protein GCM10009760_15690 [Kitasatospora kazusensis]|uniref:Uncharacterized protein n=1 Tax=Kitasatospora kazusensis TaxID=407974 RepID=A0ABN2Z3R4_9ACTN
MSLPQKPTEIAAAAAEAVRTLSQAVPDGLDYPTEVHSTVGNLMTLAEELPRSFEPLLAFLTQLNAVGALRSDRNDLDGELAAAAAALTDATTAAEDLHRALERAHAALGAVGYVTPA